MISYFIFTSITSFDVWHTAVKTALGIPRTGYNTITNAPAEDKQQTTQYTQIIKHPTNINIACFVDNTCPINLQDASAKTKYNFTSHSDAEMKSGGWFPEEII